MKKSCSESKKASNLSGKAARCDQCRRSSGCVMRVGAVLGGAGMLFFHHAILALPIIILITLAVIFFAPTAG